MATLFNSFENLGKGSFIGIRNYVNSVGEISDYVINGNISVENQKMIDLNLLKSCTEDQLQVVSEKSGVSLDICKVALSEMIESATKNLSENLSDRTAQSQGQTNAYVNLGGGLRLNKSELTVQIFGMVVSKTVKVSGEYKEVKSRPKTIAKNAIKKTLGLKADKFRSFLIENIDSVKINGNEIIL